MKSNLKKASEKDDLRYPDLSQHKILCIGEILWDLLPSGAKAGGAPMNVALHLKKFGLDAAFAGRIGSDILGSDLKDFLESQGLDTALLQIDSELPTSTVVVTLAKDNKVTFDIVDNVAWDKIKITDELRNAADQATVIIYGTLASRNSYTRQSILSLLDSVDCLKLIDVNLRPPYVDKSIIETLILKADVAKLNDEELKYIGSWYNKTGDDRELISWFAAQYHCDIICVTKGDQGAIVFEKDIFYEHPGFKVNVADTVGSGDAFLAGFLLRYLSGEDIDASLSFACATGALVATMEGGTPVYSIDEIIKLMNKDQNEELTD